MRLHSLSAETIKGSFPAPFYARAYLYFQQDRVDDLSVSKENSQADVISARVAGSDNNYYTVRVRITGQGSNLRMRGNCTCPIAINCKHVIATLLTAVNKKDVLNTKPIISVPKFERDSTVDAWLYQISSLVLQDNKSDAPASEDYALFYFLSQMNAFNSELKAGLFLVRRLKAGGFGKASRYSSTADSHQAYLSAIDRKIVHQLDILQKTHSRGYYSSSYDYPIHGEMGEKLLKELLETGRCYWKDHKTPALSLGEPKQATLNWRMDDEGFQQLSYADVDNSASFIFPVEQIWYLDQERSQIGLLETGLNSRLAKLMLAPPKVPPEQVKDVRDFIERHQSLNTLKKPKVFKKIAADFTRPIFCLHLSQEKIKFPDPRNRYSDLDAITPVVSLSFDYNGVQIPWNDPRNYAPKLQDEELIRFPRDVANEKKAVDELVDTGLFLIERTPSLSHFNRELSHLFVVGGNEKSPLEFSLEALPRLREQGWRISMDETYPFQVVEDSIEDWYSSIEEEGSGYDWFNVELGITIKGEKINLLPILQRLIKNLKNSPEIKLDEKESFFAELSDGRYLRLPMARVRNIMNVLLELYDSDSLDEDGKLRLSRWHAARLAELEAAMGAASLRWFGGEKLRNLSKKLATFEGIQNVALPKEFKGELRPYQHEGLNWLQFLREYEFGGILADDMGLGKTIQALSHLALEKKSGRMQAPSLVIAPTSLMFNWRMEAERFVPNLKVLVLHGAARKQHFNNLADYDLVLTTYPLLARDKATLLKQEFYFLILDEAQNIKNANSLAAQIALQIKAKHRLCLTGTPLENHLGELWSLFHFLMPGFLGDQKKFNQLFRVPIEKLKNEDRRQHLVRKISPFMLRRTKDKVVKELPDKVHMIRQVELEGPERDLYETIRVTMQEKVRKEIKKLGLARSHIIILDALLKLRQVCCDPRLLKIKASEKSKAKSAKLELLMSILPELMEEGRRILLFSQFTEMLGLIETELNAEKMPYVKLTGQTVDRETPVRQFQDGEIPLFLISLKAGGTGLNLTTADTVIHYDPWWNPAVENQATDRAHRIGQKKTVFVYKLIAKDTVEEKMLGMQNKKRALMEGLFSENSKGPLKLTEEDLRALFD